MWHFYSLLLLLGAICFPPAQANPTYPWPTEIIEVGSGRDRCSVSDCTCRVRPGPRPTSPTQLVEMERRHEVYFAEASHDISSTIQLEQFLQRFSDTPGLEVSIVGYTDGCGTSEYNQDLSASRAETVEDVISATLSRARISRVAAGEKVGGHYPEARRVDVVVHSSRRVTTLIEKVPADVYLIDGSGSMWNSWQPWADVINASYKRGSRIYVSIKSGCRTNQIINDISPQGGTEIWYSYWWVLSNVMRQGETLAIISDFQSDYILTSSESGIIEGLVREKQIRVIGITP